MEQLRLNQIEADPKRPEAVPVPLGPDSSTNACSIYRCKSLDSSIASYFLTRLKFSKRQTSSLVIALWICQKMCWPNHSQ
jgi:hypothetical protein